MKVKSFTFYKLNEKKPQEEQEVIFVLKNDTMLMGTFANGWFHPDHANSKPIAQRQVFCWADMNEYFN